MIAADGQWIVTSSSNWFYILWKWCCSLGSGVPNFLHTFRNLGHHWARGNFRWQVAKQAPRLVSEKERSELSSKKELPFQQA